MNSRANILGRLRRCKTGAARHVVAWFAVAYLSAGIAPCAMAASQPLHGTGAAHEHSEVAHAGHAQHERHDPAAHSHHGHGANDAAPAHDADERSRHCPHCPAGTATAPDDEHSSCFVLDDLTNVAASHAKDAPQPLAPPVGAAAFTLPPPLAVPRALPPLRAVGIAPVPLNLRHCVFLI